MKRACLLIVVPALLFALGFAQTPTAAATQIRLASRVAWGAPMAATPLSKTTPATISRSRPAPLISNHTWAMT